MAHTVTTTTNSATLVLPTTAHEPDCEHVNDLVNQLAEGSPLTAADEDYLLDYHDDCSPCFDDIRKQRIFVSFLTDRVARRQSPTALHATILSQVLA